MSLQNKIHEVLIAEKGSLFLWIPVLFGIGIITYFKLPFEPDIKLSFVLPFILIITAIFIRNKTILLWVSFVLLVISLGFLVANIRTVLVKSPSLKYETGVKRVVGTVENIYSKTHGSRFILKDVEIEGVQEKYTPKKIRVNINTDNKNATTGDRISILVSLSPPPKAVIPGGYDFSRYAYYKQIGAVGYAVSNVKIISSPEKLTIKQTISNLRQSIKENILKHSDKTSANIATALLVGDKGGIDKKTIENIRVSGIAHILAISGMHLSLVAAIFFFFSRFIFAIKSKLVLKHNIKKWAAVAAIIGSFIYLLISGAPISAQRAFIMTSLILLAVIIDRTGTPMRSVSLAALIILIFTPESILTPSFQMSFAAVFALISMYEYIKPFLKYYSEYGIFKKLSLYIFGIIFSSLVAGIATAPFAAYHFNNFAPYGIITNLIVIPLTSLFVMPFGVITLMLMPFGLDSIGLTPMLFGIDIIIKTANYISSLPQPVGMIVQMPDITLAFVTLGGIIFLFLRTKIRFYGFIPVIIGVMFSQNTHIPNIIIGNEAKLIALKTSTDSLAFSSKVHERYAREQWQERFAIKKAVTFSQTDKAIINCDSTRCHYRHDGKLASIIKHPIAIEEDCEFADLIINLTYIDTSCKNNKLTINKQDIRKNGTNVLEYKNGKYEVKTISSLYRNRLWQ